MMKKLLILLIMLCFMGFSNAISIVKKPLFIGNSDQSFEWLLGLWKRTNDNEGLQTYEHWKRINDSEYHGLGFTLKETDTVWQESIKLIKTEAKWQYVVKLQEAKAPTIFQVTNIETSAFTCENPANDFPKKIRYTKVQKGLNAVISGDGKVMLFQFEKLP